MGSLKSCVKTGNTVGLTNTVLKEGVKMKRIGQISDWDTTLELHLTWTHIHLEITQNGTTIKMELNAKKCLQLIESLMSGYKRIK
jgi:hypothetical protein